MLESHENPISCIIGRLAFITIQLTIEGHKVWMLLDNGIEIGQTYYQSPLWEKSRRLIMVRQQLLKRPKTTGELQRLCEDNELIYVYGHTHWVR